MGSIIAAADDCRLGSCSNNCKRRLDVQRTISQHCCRDGSQLHPLLPAGDSCIQLSSFITTLCCSGGKQQQGRKHTVQEHPLVHLLPKCHMNHCCLTALSPEVLENETRLRFRLRLRSLPVWLRQSSHVNQHGRDHSYCCTAAVPGSLGEL